MAEIGEEVYKFRFDFDFFVRLTSSDWPVIGRLLSFFVRQSWELGFYTDAKNFV